MTSSRLQEGLGVPSGTHRGVDHHGPPGERVHHLGHQDGPMGH